MISYGTKNQVFFRNQNEYYFALGFLANNKNAELHWEHNENQGAWGSEGRIHCLVPISRFPNNFNFTTGVGQVYARINCNEYVELLINQHHFSCNGNLNDYNEICSTIPEEFIDDFIKGYTSI